MLFPVRGCALGYLPLKRERFVSQTMSLRRVFHRPTGVEARESSALLAGGAAFVITTVIAGIVFWGRSAPISGPGSVGQFVGFAAAIAAAVVFAGTRVLMRRRASSPADGQGTRLRWFDIAALALAHGIIALLGWIGLSALLAQSFKGAVVFSVSAAILAGAAVAVTAYAAFLSAANLTPMLVSVLLAVFVSAGVLASMLSSSDPLWWQKNLSALGIADDISALAFNLTLIIAGVILTIVAHYVTAPIPAETKAEIRGRRLVRWAIALIGILLACVGIFPVDEFMQAHNLSATGMAIVYVALVIALPHLIPRLPRVFVWLGYVYVGVIVVIAVFFINGYYNLTAVELIAFLLIFSWLIVFLRNTSHLSGGPAEPVEESSSTTA